MEGHEAVVRQGLDEVADAVVGHVPDGLAVHLSSLEMGCVRTENEG